MSNTAEILASIRAQPLHVFLGMGEIEAGRGRASFEIVVDERSANPYGVLHGGVIYTLADVVCYAALLADLGADEHAVTHDIQVSIMRPAKTGDTVRFSGELVKRGRSLAFLDAQVRCGDTLMATARLTKSIIPKP